MGEILCYGWEREREINLIDEGGRGRLSRFNVPTHDAGADEADGSGGGGGRISHGDDAASGTRTEGAYGGGAPGDRVRHFTSTVLA